MQQNENNLTYLKHRYISLLIFCAISCILLSSCTASLSEESQESVMNSVVETNNDPNWEHRLYTPTFVEKIDDLYFIVDCWHHRVIYNDCITDSIDQWKTLDDTLGGPHSIASDGELYVVEDTGNHAVKVYVRDENNKFLLTQHIHDITYRPHRVLYSPVTELFYVLGSTGGNLYIFKNNKGNLELADTKTLECLQDTYVRSNRIIDGKMYFVSGKNKIVVSNYVSGSFEVMEEYPVPDEIAGMNDVQKIGEYFYISATPQKLVRVKDLEDLASGTYEDVFDNLGYRGTPYYFSMIDGRLFLPEITEYSSIISWAVDEHGDLHDMERLLDFGLPTTASEHRKAEIPT